MGNRILVTGGTGFIGSNLASALYDLGYEVVVIGTKTEQKPSCTRFINLGLFGIDWTRQGDFDACFHLAANNDTLDTDRDEMFRANFSSAVDLFYSLRENCNCQKFIYASSTAVYGNAPVPYLEDQTVPNPLSAYAESKLAFDKFAVRFAEQHKVSVIGLRYTNVYGPGEQHKGRRASMIHQMMQKMMQGMRPRLFQWGEQKRDWVYVKDVVAANLAALVYPGSGIFNCGSGAATSFNDLAALLNKYLETDLQPEYIENPIEGAFQNLTLADMTKAKEFLGFVPHYGVERGIEEYVEETKKASR